MAIDVQERKPTASRPRRRFVPKFLRYVWVPVRNFVSHHIFSSLTRRILILNLAALAVLVVGVLYLNQFRTGLIKARIDSLQTMGQLVAGAIAASATVDTDSLRIDPEKLFELQAGQSIAPRTDGLDNLDFPIDPEKFVPVLRRLIPAIGTRTRVYDRDANLLHDSLGQVLRYNNPAPEESIGFLARIEKLFADTFLRTNLPLYKEQPGEAGSGFPEVLSALTGGTSTQVRISDRGEQIVSVAVPIQRYRAVLGVLLLTTQGGEIDQIIADERRSILRVFGVAALANAVLSILLASTIANPLRRLAAAAVRVRRGVKNREEIPDYSYREDEVGNLSVAVRDMTNALYARIDAIESFAADVSHELKNPLTSLRSAVETLPLAKNEQSRNRLMEVIQHDVRRLDRLITDISDASRLDAELAREDASRVDLQKLVSELVAASNDAGRKKKAQIDFVAEKLPQGAKGYFIQGHDLRLGQVLTNLIENARSFVPDEGGRITVRLARVSKFNVIAVDDNGPGIRPDAIERIFERFYTDRPSGEAFGQNSGLGLSISRQIIEAHGGSLTAENIPGAKPGEIKGARFVATLPAEA